MMIEYAGSANTFQKNGLLLIWLSKIETYMFIPTNNTKAIASKIQR